MLKQAINFYRTRRDWFGEGGKPVAAPQSQARSDQCLKCPMNQRMPIWELFAGAAATAVRRQLEAKNELNLSVRGEENLHVCSACLCVLSLKVHTPLKFILATTPLEGLHPDCWILSEMKITNTKE